MWALTNTEPPVYLLLRLSARAAGRFAEAMRKNALSFVV
jgi:hypothetical protein